MNDLELCSGPSGCGHPRSEHTAPHPKGTKTSCRHPLAQGRSTCACNEFRGIRSNSSASKRVMEVPRG